MKSYYFLPYTTEPSADSFDLFLVFVPFIASFGLEGEFSFESSALLAFAHDVTYWYYGSSEIPVLFNY